VIRRLLGRPLDWRFGAVITRLDSLLGDVERLDARLSAFNQPPPEPRASLAPADVTSHIAARQVSQPRYSLSDYDGPEHDSPVRARPECSVRSYVVCSTPRSGSGLLCRGLAGTGALGVPLEYFNPATRATLSERWRCGPDLQGYLDALHSRRATGTGVFGVKVHWDQLSLVRAEAEARQNDHFVYETPDALLDRLFPRARFVRIVRQDLDRQAVSYWRALNSNVWSVGIDGQSGMEAETPYSFEGIDSCRRWVEHGELCWDRLLRARKEDALVVTYEELVANVARTVERVADYISPETSVTIPTPSTRRQSDERSSELLERFRSDRAARL
jgi:LPS sulfotransferase NodH